MADQLEKLERLGISPRSIIRIVIGRELSQVTLNLERIKSFLIKEMRLTLEDREIVLIVKRMDPSNSGKIGL